MKQCLSPEVWTGLLEGGLSKEEKSLAEAHLAMCSHCSFVASELVRVEQILTGAGEQARARAALDPAQIRLAFDRFHVRTREPRGMACCLEALRFFLSGMLGESAGRTVVWAAAGQKEITEAAWPGFIARLSDTIADLCGEGAGAIVSYIGKLNLPEIA
jgi:hypothetical protein